MDYEKKKASKKGLKSSLSNWVNIFSVIQFFVIKNSKFDPSQLDVSKSGLHAAR